MSNAPVEIVCAHSPDSDDAYMFYALATKKIRSPFVEVRHLLDDIQTLNVKARQGAYELTAISYHAYPYIADKYALMAAGSSIGDNYGPMVVANRPMAVEDLKGKRIAIPGLMTTAYLTLKLMQPDFEPLVVPFDKILDAVHDQAADAGLIIHEAQLTYAKSGFHNIVDLGKWWKTTQGLPLPLGANALRRDLSPEVAKEACRLMRESIQYALDHREEALAYAMQFARDMEAPLAERFVGMYVNHYTVDCGDVVPKAAQKLLDMGFEAGIIPHRVAGRVCAVKRVILLLLATTFGFSQTAPDPAAEPKQRIRAVRDLAKQGVDSIPKIAPYLSDPDVSVRVETVKALIDIGGPRDGRALLVTATKDNDSEIQIRAAEGSGERLPAGLCQERSQRVAATRRRCGSRQVRRLNDQMIDAFVTVRPEVISALGRLVRGGASWESRAAAARALGVLRGRAALDDLVEAVHSKEDQLMFEALIAIQKIRDPSAGPRIAFRLRDLDDRIQIATLETTGILRNQAAAAEVADVFDHARNVKIKHSAAEALAQLARPADRAFFVVWLNDQDDVFRARRRRRLGQTEDPCRSSRSGKGSAGRAQHERPRSPWCSGWCRWVIWTRRS